MKSKVCTVSALPSEVFTFFFTVASSSSLSLNIHAAK